MSRVLIIGYGNPLRGDDGFGPVLAQRLQNAFAGNGAIEIIAAHQLTIELAEPLSRAARAIFLDANNGDTPGEISLQTIDAARETFSQNNARFSHHLSPQMLLAYAQNLYGARPRETFLLSVSGANFEYSEELSAPVARAADEAFARVTALCGDAV